MRVSKQKCYGHISFSRFYCIALVVFFMTPIVNPVFSQRQPCVTEDSVTKKTNKAKAAETKAKKAAEDFNKLPQPKPKPVGDKDVAAAKTALDALRIKWDKSKDALTDAKKNLKPGSDESSLKQDIANKQKEIEDKQEESKKKDSKAYIDNASKITEFEAEFKNRINGFTRATARDVLDNTDYKKIDFSKKVIDDCAGEKSIRHNSGKELVRPECYSERGEEILKIDRFKNEKITQLREALQNAVTAANAQGKVSGASKEAPWETISKVGPELLKEMENTRTDLKGKYTEYVKLDNGIGILNDQINALRAEKKILEDQLKPITEADKKANDAKKEYDEAEKKWKETEKKMQDIKDWEAADTKRKNGEKEMNDAAAEKTKADTEKTNADKDDAAFKVQAKTDLTQAETDATISTMDSRMNTVNQPLMDQVRTQVLARARVQQVRAELKQQMTTLKTEPERAALRTKWQQALERAVRPEYIRRRNQAESDRLQAIRDRPGLQDHNCIQEVADFINLLSQEMIKVMNRRTSLASDMDAGIAEGADEPIPIGPIPPLDEGEGTDTPTDEVPDDIVKNTSEVKVFNVRPGAWLSTGIQLKKGQQYSITAKGTVTRQGDRTWGPDGYYLVGYMAHSLKALIGDKLVEIGSSKSGTAPVDGELKLGITWTYEGINPADSKHKGSFVATVTIDGK